MDRRDFIKLTAITGTSATLAGCGNPEHQLIRFVPDEDLVPGVAEWKPSVCPLCAAGCGLSVRVMEADVETTRNGQAGVVQDGRREEARRRPEGSDQPGRAVRARPGGDSDHLSPRPPDAADEAHRRARRRRVQAGHVGRGDRRARRATGRARRGRRSEIARLPRPAAQRTPRRARRGVPGEVRRAGARRVRSVWRRGPAPGERDQLRPRAVADARPGTITVRARLRRRFSRDLELAGRAKRRVWRDAAGAADAGHSRHMCRSNRACP